MIAPPRFRVSEIAAFEWPFTLRMPFRYGTATVTQGRQVVIRLRITLPDGRSAEGMAAETLAIKWFDKNPALSDEENLDQLRRSIEYAMDAYLAHGPDTAFRHFAASYGGLMAAGRADGLPPLVAGFGPSLLDRAVADALGRVLGLPFAELVRSNALGIRPGVLAPDLLDFDADAFLAGLEPAEHLAIRHTVGLLDPTTSTDQGHRLEDGLPETLEEIVAAYQPRYFKLKVGSASSAEISRLCRIAAVLDRIDAPWWVTLDGNEQFADTEQAMVLLQAILTEKRLARLARGLLFIEQPVRRADAQTQDVTPLARFAPVVLDESDGEMESFVVARRLGYRGVSSKTCKGFYKSLLNAMRCAAWNAEAGQPLYFMTAEDLNTLAGLSVQQDLVLAGLLGVGHVERNGHHFVDGFTGRAAAEARQFVAEHPDLYDARSGAARLRITDGTVALGSLGVPGFGTAVHPDTSWMAPMASSAWMAFLTGKSMAS